MADETVPKVFISYSHDSDTHKRWVGNLADRLIKNGVDVTLDQFDLTLGRDLPLFMEGGLSAAKRVLAVCSDSYVKKANGGTGGVGYERMILTAELLNNIDSDRIIPLIRNNSASLGQQKPTFLSTRLHLDFSSDADFELRYIDLIRDLHGETVRARPPLGPNPFRHTPPVDVRPPVFGPEQYSSWSLQGTVIFNPSNNNGRYVVGHGDQAFETQWSVAGSNCVWAYSDSTGIRSVALADDVSEIGSIADALRYDVSSRARFARAGEIFVWQNTAGYFLATKVLSAQRREQRGAADNLEFAYVIAPLKSACFQRP